MKNANPFSPPVSLNAPRDQIAQELDELFEISAMIDSHLENIDHDQIVVPLPASPEQVLYGFFDPPKFLDINDIVLNAESVNTPLVSPFLDSDDESDDSEDIEKYIEVGLSEVVMGKPSKDLTHLEDDCGKGLISFTKI
ncbi:hypothetical protein Tco_0002751 [Tanacetum coccineum]